MDTIDLVIDNLKSLGINFEILRPKIQQQLIEIENYLSESQSSRKKCFDTLRKYNLTIKNISDNTTVSKATIYNNKDILKLYIDKRVSLIKSLEKDESIFISPDKYHHLETNYDDQSQLLNKVTVELINMNNLKKRLQLLEDTNKALLLKIENLSKDNYLSPSELNTIIDESSTHTKNNIINLDI